MKAERTMLRQESKNYETIKEQLVQVIYTNIAELNGEETEEDLNMIISERIAEDRLTHTIIDNKDSIHGYIESTKVGVVDSEDIEPNGAWIYRDETHNDWMLQRYDTIADAIRSAVKLINAMVLCDAMVIDYDTIDNDTAYYIDKRTDSVKVVELNK